MSQKHLTDNPAGRLVSLVNRIRTYDLGKRSLDVWQKILGADGVLEVANRFALVLTLPKAAKDSIESIPDINHELHLRWVPALQQALAGHSFNSPMNTFTTPIDGPAMYALEYCADLLSNRRPKKVIEQSELESLAHKIDQLRQDVAVADLSSAVKEYIFDNLDLISGAIRDYQFVGVRPLERALHATVGSIPFKKQEALQMKGTDFSKRFWEIVGRIAMILSVVNSAVQLTKSVDQLLLEAPATISAQSTEVLVEQESTAEYPSTGPEQEDKAS
jgi:hypothetical protein